MTKEKFPKEFLERLSAVTSKRAKTVIDHILEHGFITTEELEKQYGYKHPPRAARDVREQGIPLETFTVKNSEGRAIAAYRFADPTQVRNDRIGGRRIFSKEFKQSLMQAQGAKCAICFGEYEDRYLQIDHRVPYEVSGDPGDAERNPEDYMLICGSCNRAKSWSCEHCINWLEEKSPALCETCYWGRPDSYKHIALRAIRRLDVVWSEDEVQVYDKLQQRAQSNNAPMPDYVKSILKNHVETGDK